MLVSEQVSWIVRTVWKKKKKKSQNPSQIYALGKNSFLFLSWWLCMIYHILGRHFKLAAAVTETMPAPTSTDAFVRDRTESETVP